jgi:hypothetical protein
LARDIQERRAVQEAFVFSPDRHTPGLGTRASF